MLNLISHMTEHEKAEAVAFLEAPDVDAEVSNQLAIDGADINELAHWQTCKRRTCFRLKIEEPPFTREEFLSIFNARSEEDKRRVFKEIKMTTVINAEDIPKAHGIMDKLDAADRLTLLLIQRDEIVAKKKAAMSEFKDLINSLDKQIISEANDYQSGQKRLFSGDETKNVQ